MPSAELLEAIAVTAELTGTVLSEAAARVMVSDLQDESEADVLRALTRCRKELKGRLTVGEILSRVPNGHPTPEEAWSLCHKALGDESETLILTYPMRVAFFSADCLAKDKIAARMAFLEVYRREVATAPKAHWGIMAGWDGAKRVDAVLAATQSGKLPQEHAKAFLPAPEMPAQVLELWKHKKIA